ncbi:hypothetical protein ES703_17932 [subsurface metagenome]
MSFEYDVKNSPDWLAETSELLIDRVSLLAVCAFIEIGLRHPGIPAGVVSMGKMVGSRILIKLLLDGLVLPDKVKERWFASFGMSEEDF